MNVGANGAHERTDNHVSNFEFRPFGESRRRWRDIVAAGRPTLFHDDRWFETVARVYGLSLWLASIRTSSGAIAGCIMARRRRGSRMVSLPFSDSGPPLFDGVDAARELACAIAQRFAVCEIRGFEAPAPWEILNCFVNHELVLNRTAAETRGRMARAFRQNVARAEKSDLNVECGDSAEQMARFYAMHEATRRRKGLPCQPARFFEMLRRAYHPRAALKVWLASKEKRDIAGAVTICDGRIAYYKWSARADDDNSCGSHLVAWNVLEHFVGKAAVLDFGRTDIRNEGLVRFKRGIGAEAVPNPYSYFPRAPQNASAEVSTGARAVASEILRRMPRMLYRPISNALYAYFA